MEKTFQQQLYDLENAARKFIVDKLDEVGEIILFDEKQVFKFDDEEDELLWELPTQNFIGKYNTNYDYKIIKLYKEEKSYYATGRNYEDATQYYEFDLFTGIDTDVMVYMADLINNL